MYSPSTRHEVIHRCVDTAGIPYSDYNILLNCRVYDLYIEEYRNKVYDMLSHIRTNPIIACGYPTDMFDNVEDVVDDRHRFTVDGISHKAFLAGVSVNNNCRPYAYYCDKHDLYRIYYPDDKKQRVLFREVSDETLLKYSDMCAFVMQCRVTNNQKEFIMNNTKSLVPRIPKIPTVLQFIEKSEILRSSEVRSWMGLV